jgi:hypothetical protein
MTATAPSVTRPGIVDVILRDNYGNSTPDDNSKFQYFAPLPQMTSITPQYISTWVQTNVVIEGYNLWDTNKVSWERIPYISTNSEIVNINGSITTVKSPVTDSDGISTIVYVTTPTGRSLNGININYVKVPLILDMSTHQGDYRGGSNVSVTGVNFANATGVGVRRGVFGTKFPATSFNVVNNTFMYFLTPPVTDVGVQYYVYVDGPKGSTVEGGDANAYFNYYSLSPAVNDLNIDQIPVRGWVDIIATGNNFALQGSTYRAFFGEGSSVIYAPQINVINNTSMVIYTPVVANSFVNNQVHVRVESSLYGNSSLSPNNIITWANNSKTIANVQITYKGSGYSVDRATAVARLFSNGYTSNAIGVGIVTHDPVFNSNNNGRVLNFESNTKYAHVFNYAFEPVPAIIFDPPEKYGFPANSKGMNSNGFALNGGNRCWAISDKVYYEVPYGNTAFAPLTGNTWYYIAEAQQFYVKLKSSPSGATIDITDPRQTSTVNAEVHFLQGETATAKANMF